MLQTPSQPPTIQAEPPPGRPPGATPTKRPALLSATRLSGMGTGIIWPLAALALLLMFNFLFSPGFFHVEIKDGRLYGSLIDILNRGAPLMLLALGMTLVIATGGVDLSVGAVMALAGTFAACLISHAKLIERADASPLAALNLTGNLPVVLAIALAVALVAGLWNGLLVAVLDIQPIVATLILMVAGRGIAQLLTTNVQIPFSDQGLIFLGSGFFLGLPFPLFIVAGALVLTGVLARRTALGLFIESVGNNPTASRFAGINARFVRMAAYAFCGLCAGLAGVVKVADIHQLDASTVGLYSELDAILAVSIGGTALTGGRFSLIGSMIGALLLQTLATTINTKGVPAEVTLVLEAVLIVLVCLLQSETFRGELKRRFGNRRAAA